MRFIKIALLLYVLIQSTAIKPVRAYQDNLGSPLKNKAQFPESLGFEEIISGLASPVFITHANDGTNRLFIIEKAGYIRVFNNNSLLSIPFLDVDSIVNSEGERGLFALAFHPGYQANGRFYIVYNNNSGALVLASFLRSPSDINVADSSSQITLLTIPKNYSNHNGGTLAFGVDGYLYWSTGDGGGGGDPDNNAQNLNSLLGKIIRIDVDTGSPYTIPDTNPFYNSTDPLIRQEIWAYGLRNPWRFSFDRLTHDLYIGDVGQGAREEISFQPADSTGGENYGWRIMEGNLCYNPPSGCNQSNKVLPIAEYSHSLGCSVTGGYVYRGELYPEFRGVYFYGDFCSGKIFSLYHDPVNGWINTQVVDTSYSISTFGEDEDGEIYFADYSGGKVYKLTFPTTVVNSVLPTSRSVQVNTTATIFNTVINAGVNIAHNTVLSISKIPSGAISGDFEYYQTNCSTNQIIGSQNPILDISPGGIVCYILLFTPSSAFNATSHHISVKADNSSTSELFNGINTWLLRATVSAGADIIALTTTADFHQIACSGTKAFAVALANVGTDTTGDITAVAHTGSNILPVNISITETDSATGDIIGDHILQNVVANENRTVAVFVTFNGCISFNPALNRIFIEFKDEDNNILGSTSTAISTNR